MRAWMLLWPALAVTAYGQDAERRAIAYLAREVPQWSKQNRCFSCHNNGDAARALYAAQHFGFQVPPEALADTTAWLLRPLDWDNNRGDPAFSDKKLARIQFAASLGEAAEAGLVKDRKALIQAADSLLQYQEADGSWQVDTGAAVGSPVTYGACLATYMARRTLERADPVRFRDAIAKADAWLQAAPANTIPDAAAVALALNAGGKKRQALKTILHSQNSDGGWGPHPHSPSEAFDTAIALLALRTFVDQPEIRERIQRGRTYLDRAQLESGGWPETTRPAGGRSYAQHISTTGWATLALLETPETGSAGMPRDTKR